MKHKNLLALVALATPLILLGCGKKEVTTSEDTQIIKIGVVGPLTGSSAIYGQDDDRGARLAADEINAKGLIIDGKKAQIKIVSEDDGTDPKQATMVAQELVDEGVSGVIGHYNSGTSIVAASIYAKAGIAQITPSASNPKFTRLGLKTTFRLAADDERSAHVLANYAKNQLHIETVAVIDDRTDFGQGFANEFIKAFASLGGKVLSREFTTSTATDFSAILTNIKAEKPQLVFLGGLDQTAGPILRQMHSLDVNAKFMAGLGVCTPQLIALAGKEALGDNKVCCSEAHGLDKNNEAAMEQFTRAFTQKYGGPPILYAANAYDALNVMVAAMEKAGSSDPKKYLPVLAKTTNYPGITANITFDSRGDIENAPISLETVRDNKFVNLVTVR